MKANQDIRDYMADRGVSQVKLAKQMNTYQAMVSAKLRKELSEQEKENFLKHIDACVQSSNEPEIDSEVTEEAAEEVTEETTDVSVTTSFQIGDRVKIPSKEGKIGTISDIWHSLSQDKLLYAVDTEGGIRGLYAEAQLEPAPLPTEYSWEAHIDGNVAVCTMIATQGEKTWIYARGHAHIIHNGEVGMAQAISYAARRMFESLDGDSKIYVKNGGNF
jgi:predicted transcriptional regulator